MPPELSEMRVETQVSTMYIHNRPINIKQMRPMPIIWIAVFLLALAWGSSALAHDTGDHGDGRPHPDRQHNRIGVTPYGDFCPRCNLYGVGKQPVSYKVALDALGDYFKNKGFTIRIIQGGGRFLKADVFKDGKFVDRILFDRRTGRIRSIF